MLSLSNDRDFYKHVAQKSDELRDLDTHHTKRNHTTYAIKHAHKSYYSDTTEQNKDGWKKLWKTIKSASV